MAKKPGDVVIVEFPFTELGKSKFRPAIVLEVMESLNVGNWLRVAYGTSQHATEKELQEGDFLISRSKGENVFGVSGLRKDTKFVLTLHAKIAASRAKVIGCVHGNLMRDFYHAAKAADLL